MKRRFENCSALTVRTRGRRRSYRPPDAFTCILPRLGTLTKEKKVRVVAGVVIRDGHFMICQRPWAKRHGGLWEFPGGKAEENESDADAIKRELWEELGVSITGVAPPELALEDPNSSFLIVFLPVRIEGHPSPREHLQIKWVSASELLELPLAPSDRVFAEHLTAS